MSSGAFLYGVMFFCCGPAVLLLAMSGQLNDRGVGVLVTIAFVYFGAVFAYSGRKKHR